MIDRRSHLAQMDIYLPVRTVRQVPPKYQLTVNGITHYWSGRGRLPNAFDDYIYVTNGHRLSNDVLKELLIVGTSEVQS